MKFKKGKKYTYEEIEEFTNDNPDFTQNEYGKETLGEFIISLVNRDLGYGVSINFVMVSLNLYACVFTDIS